MIGTKLLAVSRTWEKNRFGRFMFLLRRNEKNRFLLDFLETSRFRQKAFTPKTKRRMEGHSIDMKTTRFLILRGSDRLDDQTRRKNVEHKNTEWPQKLEHLTVVKIS